MKISTRAAAPLRLAGITLAAAMTAARCYAAAPVDEVNVFIGTGGHGHTYPGATVPFGFVQLSPDTPIKGWDAASGYHYSQSKITGFSHNHLSGTGVGDLGDVQLMPVAGDLQTGNDYQPLTSTRLASDFSHDDEVASPGYYSVKLSRYDVKAELTATAHAGLHRYTFPAAQARHVVVDLIHGIGNHVMEGSLQVEGDHRLVGYRKTNGWAGNRPIYFVIESSTPWIGVELEKDGKPAPGTSAGGKEMRAALHFAPGTALNTAPIVLRVGLSATSIDAAKKNLAADVPDFDFDAIRAAANKQWNDSLSRLTIETPDADLRKTFYTAMYHTLIAPTLYNDADGTYLGHDGKVHIGEGFTNYSTFSFWDTFRTEHPLLTLVQPQRVNDFVRSALTFYSQSKEHALPIWPLANAETHCMIGYHSVPVIYDAYAKGFRGFDATEALAAMVDTARHSDRVPKDYEQRGYVAAKPNDGAQAASRTVEYAYDDWCIARMAEALGQKEVTKEFDARSKFYANVFDKETGFMRGKLASGEWRTPFNPLAINACYTEANAWQYSFFAPHDLPGLAALFGGADAMIAKLDECFNQDVGMPNPLVDVTGLIGQYSQGNEPCHNMAYLYALLGAPDKTERKAHEIMRLQYDNTPEGLPGNDDCGQMSAWYAFSTIGLYPANPADGRYVIGSPLVRSATLQIDPKYAAKDATGKTFTVLAPAVNSQNVYVQSAKLNGQSLTRPWVTHEEITRGGTLELEMGMLPNRTWSNTLTPADGSRYQITMDSSKAPEMQAFADRVLAVANEWYAKELDIVRPNDPTAAKYIHIVIDPAYDGVAATMGDRIVLSQKYFTAHPNDLGAIVHEVAHVVQAYPSGKSPWWFQEGFADYIRWFMYEPANRRPHPDGRKAKYSDGYQTSGTFLNWVAETYGQKAVLQVNADCHAGKYNDDLWQTYTGKSLTALGDEWEAAITPSH